MLATTRRPLARTQLSCAVSPTPMSRMMAGIIMREFVGANTQVVPATLIETGETACTGPVTVTFFGTAPTATLVVTSAAAATASHLRYRIPYLLESIESSTNKVPAFGHRYVSACNKRAKSTCDRRRNDARTRPRARLLGARRGCARRSLPRRRTAWEARPRAGADRLAGEPGRARPCGPAGEGRPRARLRAMGRTGRGRLSDARGDLRFAAGRASRSCACCRGGELLSRRGCSATGCGGLPKAGWPRR